MISVKALAHEIRQSRTSAVAALNEHLDVIDEMEGEIQVTVIATGFETNQPLKQQRIKNRYNTI